MITYEITAEELKTSAKILGLSANIKTAKLIVSALDIPITPKGIAQRLYLNHTSATIRNARKILKAMPQEYEVLTALGYTANNALYDRLAKCDLSLIARILAEPEPQCVIRITPALKTNTEKKKSIRLCRDCDSPAPPLKHLCDVCREKKPRTCRDCTNPVPPNKHLCDACRKPPSDHGLSGKLWWNNGIRNERSRTCPGIDFVRGRLNARFGK